jgi:Flp pilus assembly protein TadD
VKNSKHEAQEYWQLALRDYNIGNYQGALHALETAAGLDPDLDILYYRGCTLLAMGRAEEALDVLMEADKKTPKDSEILKEIGVAFATLNQVENAINSFLLSLKANPRNAEAEYLVALAYVRKNESENAESHFRNALRLDQQFVGALQGLAAIYKHKGNITKATAYIQLAAEQEPRNLRLLSILQELYCVGGKFKDAQDILLKRYPEIKNQLCFPPWGYPM